MRQKLLFFITLTGFFVAQLKAQTDSKCYSEINKFCQSGRSEKETLTWYSFNEGHSKAVRENKILMINVSTDWCYPCKLMNKHTYTHRGVIDTLNKYFVCVYLNPDIDTSYMLNGNKITPKELIKYLYVDEQVGYPTSLFWLHPESEEKHCVHRGFMEPPIYLKLLTAARAARPISWLGISLKLDNGEP